MSKDDAIKEIVEYLQDVDKCISEDEDYLRGWESGLLVALELLYKID